MKRVWGHVIAGAALAGLGVATISACAHDNSTLFIRDVLAQQLVTNGQQCLYTADPTQPYITNGVLDIDFLDAYTATFLVGNQAVPVGNPSTPNTETSRITLQGGIVRITDSAGNQLASYTRYAATTIDPLSGTEPSYAPIALTILDENTVAGIAGQVASGGTVRLVTYTRVYGYTLGGDYVESGDFEFPVDVCKGCLITFAPEDMDPAYPEPNCVAAAKNATTTSLPVPCNPGQDDTIDCSQCQGVPDCAGRGPSFASVLDGGAD